VSFQVDGSCKLQVAEVRSTTEEHRGCHPGKQRGGRERGGGGGWWREEERRRESNPRPKLPTTESFHAFSRFIFVSSPALRTDEDATATSLIDLVIAVQTEQL
jgi:hypothetical protein